MEVLKKRMLGKKLNKEDKSDLLVHYTECVQPESKTDSNKIVLQPQPVPVKISDQLSSKIGVLAENAALKYSYPIGENVDCNKTETIKPIPKPRQKSGQSLKIDANENLQQNPQPCQRLCKALNIDAKENGKPLPPPRKRNNVSQRRKHESLQICDKENVKPKSSKTRQDTSVLRSPHNENINQSTSLSNSLTKMNLNKTLQKPTPLEGWKDSILSIPRKWLSTAESVDEFGFPDTLPKVPVPPLEQTMADYLRALEPITTQAQLERTKALIKEFTAPDGLGPKLHQYLLEKREAEDNWAYYYWLNDMYMDIRLPLPINSNPGMVLPPRRFTTVHDVARFAARILDGIMLHKEMLESGKLPQERAASREKNQPLCMTQYYRLLGSCRRPGIERDSQYLPRVQTPFLIHLSIEDEDQHVIVICRNQMYCVVLKATDRGKLSESEMASQILYVLSDAPCLPAKPPPVGLLTAEPRPIWAQDRAILMQSVQNQRNIDLIETALIVLCLDEPLPTIFNARGFTGATPSVHKSGDRDETNMAHEMIHGGGSEYNSANRWFDKTMQIIICTDGTWGLCYEHSTSEGIAVVQLLEKIFKNILENPSEDNGVPQHHLPPPERLEWEVAPQIKQRFKQAVITVDKAIDNLDFYVYRYQGYGKNFIKASQVSPDVYIQLSLQLAYFKLYGKLVTTYESASTRRFLLGRVDCIRSASSEALEWAKAMCQGEGANVPLESDREDEEDSRKVHFSIYSKDHLRELFRCAVARQTEVMVQNILGNGIDIPLLGLREASRELEGQLHELFTDESYKIANCFLLSTSQVACSTDSFMGYGPVTPRGYGCSYNPHPDQIVFCVSAFYSCEDTSASRYAKSLQESLDIMRDLLKN